MDDNSNFETFLLISSNKIKIIVCNDLEQKIYENETEFQDISRNLIIHKLDQFLDENIFKVEKKIKNFIKKISIILDLDIFFSLDISVKKNNFDNSIETINLNHLLYDAKDCCKKTIDEKKIIHMIIENYKIDNKNYSFLPNGINCNNFSIDVKFICVPYEVLKNLEKTLKKYQISLNQLLSASYVCQFSIENENDIVLTAKKLMKGYNSNEVFLIDKTNKNLGFFERFFNLFN